MLRGMVDPRRILEPDLSNNDRFEIALDVLAQVPLEPGAPAVHQLAVAWSRRHRHVVKLSEWPEPDVCLSAGSVSWPLEPLLLRVDALDQSVIFCTSWNLTNDRPELWMVVEHSWCDLTTIHPLVGSADLYEMVCAARSENGVEFNAVDLAVQRVVGGAVCYFLQKQKHTVDAILRMPKQERASLLRGLGFEPPEEM
jgi:hypothetical protein